MTPTEFDRVVRIAEQHNMCDEGSCLAGEDEWRCSYARALLQCQTEKEKAKAELLSFYRIAESGVWVETAKYSGLIGELAQLKAVVAKKDERLQAALNYLHHNTDDLVGDDLVGDKRRTRSFENMAKGIEDAMRSTPSQALERDRARDKVVAAARVAASTLEYYRDAYFNGEFDRKIWDDLAAKNSLADSQISEAIEALDAVG